MTDVSKIGRRLAGAALLGLCTAAPAGAVEATWSGFATLGYARSDSDFTYQGSINRQGTLWRDSLLAGQVDLRFNPQWSATLQAKVASCEDREKQACARASWAFLAWRPNNDWLVRAGKVRLPLYLNSESLDVGVSHDMARMPFEMYSIAPTNDFTGLFVTRGFTWGQRDVTLEGFSGAAEATARLWLRDGVPPMRLPGPLFRAVDVKVRGLVLTVRDESLAWRVGLLSTRTWPAEGGGLPLRFPRVDLAPGLGYWQVTNALPGPGIPRTEFIRNFAVTAGADWTFAPRWRVAGEFVRMIQHDTELGSDSRAGYVALFHTVGAFTPYVSVARQRSSDGVLGWSERLTQPSMPGSVPGGDVINAAQRVAGESLYAFDQRSLALGVSYALSPTMKLKGEWMRTRVGRTSLHFDVPPGQPGTGGLQVHTLSANLSVAF